MKPMLVGANNPLHSAPEYALYPYPPGCTGDRIFQMLESRIPDIRRKQYLDGFERRNLVNSKVWDAKEAERGAAKLEQELWGSGRVVVLLGNDVRAAFRHPRSLLHPYIVGGVTYRQIPHPSGRNLFYNDATNRELVARLLEDLYRCHVPA